MPAGWSQTHPAGIIYCNLDPAKSLFPCIVEDIKEVFKIPRRGLFRININNIEYILYYVPISIKQEVIWETPLHKIPLKHPLRSNPRFKHDIRRIFIFCDILSLMRTSESTIRIRPGVDETFVPINVNEMGTTITKGDVYDYSVLTKMLFSRWFGEEISVNSVVKEMVEDITGIKYTCENLAQIAWEIRSRIDIIIRKYDRNLVWYSNFILDRLSRHLLATNMT